jgi:SAM-dependent MidA family methyltransferase
MSDTRTPLDIDIRRRIAAAGPMPVGQFMALCLADPQHGYYVTRDPLGAGGDFTTAPEVSQMFGELIGLWMVNVWQQLGSPENLRIVELGPGRGTMMKDAMRAAKVVPAFAQAAVLHMVEISPALQTLQEASLAELNIPVFWHKTLAEVPDGPAVIVANEFFDALPINQAVKMADGWHRRAVTVAPDDSLTYVAEPLPLAHFEATLPAAVRAAREGEIFEWRSDTETMELGRRLAREPSAALVIDYGHVESATGETLQALREQLFAEPLSAPGEADLTAHVDFAALARKVETMGAKVYGPVEQAEFLLRLGIETRAAQLKAGAERAKGQEKAQENAQEKSREIDAALARLTGTGRTGMGSLFKAAAITHPSMPPPPAFEA